jgi:hypothetical protein
MKVFMELAVTTALMGAAHAQEKEPTPQQALMGTCNAEAKTKDLKGEEQDGSSWPSA